MEILINDGGSISFEMWIAFGALLISLISIIFAARTIRIQRIHNLKSVLPIAFISVGDYEDHLFVKITNHGIGPMIISDLKISIDKEIRDNLIDFFRISFLPGFRWKEINREIIGRAIKVDDELILFDIEKPELIQSQENISIWEEDIKNEIHSKLKKMEIVISYTSVYKKKAIHE